MTDGTRTDGSAGVGRPGEVVLSSAMAEVRQWAADPDTDAARVGTPEGGRVRWAGRHWRAQRRRRTVVPPAHRPPARAPEVEATH
jgi:hypothetical protein